jgi:hypothetical protein
MRTLISLLVVLSFSIVDLAASPAAAWAAGTSTRGATSPSRPAVQARAKKKKRPRPAKVKSAEKKPEKAKKNDRGFEL